VRRLAAAPADLGELAASAGDDGAVCLLSLAAGACARALPGPPGAAPARLAWAPALGYVAALYAGSGPAGAGAVGLVWDLHSGARDRVVTGAAAAALLDNFAAMHGGGGAARARAAVRLAEPCAAGAPPRLPAGLALLEVDAEALLAGPAKPHAARAAPGAAADAAAGCVAAALAQALAQLHVWGLDAGVDAALLALLDEAGLARLPGGAAGENDPAREAGPRGAMGAGAPPARAALGLGQGAAAGVGGGVTLQLPGRAVLPGFDAAAAPPGAAHLAGMSGLGPVPNGAHGGAAVPAAEPAAPAWRPGLLTGDGAFVAARLLAAVGVAKALMGRPPATEARCGGCAAAAALYAVGVRGALPGLAAPALAAYVARWQACSPAKPYALARRRRRVSVSGIAAVPVPRIRAWPAPWAARHTRHSPCASSAQQGMRQACSRSNARRRRCSAGRERGAAGGRARAAGGGDRPARLRVAPRLRGAAGRLGAGGRPAGRGRAADRSASSLLSWCRVCIKRCSLTPHDAWRRLGRAHGTPLAPAARNTRQSCGARRGAGAQRRRARLRASGGGGRRVRAAPAARARRAGRGHGGRAGGRRVRRRARRAAGAGRRAAGGGAGGAAGAARAAAPGPAAGADAAVRPGRAAPRRAALPARAGRAPSQPACSGARRVAQGLGQAHAGSGCPARALSQPYKCTAGEMPAGHGRLVCRPPRHSFVPG